MDGLFVGRFWLHECRQSETVIRLSPGIS